MTDSLGRRERIEEGEEDDNEVKNERNEKVKI